MKQVNAVLAVVAAVLFLGSVWSYRESVTRPERFERGRKLLGNLNPDHVAAITLEKGDDTIHLKRQKDHFVVAEAHDYPAKNEAVNRLLRDLLDITLAREMGTGEDLEKELGLASGTEDALGVVLEDDAGKPMVHLRVGKTPEDGDGRFVERLDTDPPTIYRTEKGLYLSDQQDAFLDKEIVDVAAKDVQRVEGQDFVLEREGDTLTLADVPAGKKAKTSEVSKVGGALSRLSFDEVYLADDETVRDLDFQDRLKFELDDQTGYVVATAEEGDRHFLRIRGTHSLGQVTITRDEAQSELEKKADSLSRADEIDRFNDFHGSWVYEVSDWTAGKLGLDRKDLLESS